MKPRLPLILLCLTAYTVHANVTLLITPIQIAYTTTAPTCGLANGSIDVTVTGGRAPYTYTWFNGRTTEDLTGIAAGTYGLVVRDANKSVLKYSITLEGPAPLTAHDSVSNSLCNTEGYFFVAVRVRGGTAPYSYHWAHHNDTSAYLSNLNSGTDTVTVTDAKGCMTRASYYIPAGIPRWDCLIIPPDSIPGCGTSGNYIHTNVQADSYAWFVQSEDPSWRIEGSNNMAYALFTAGHRNTTARFILLITKSGCANQTCFYTVEACKDHTITSAENLPGDTLWAPHPPDNMLMSVVPDPVQDSNLQFQWQSDEDDYIAVTLYDKFGKKVSQVYEGPVSKGQAYKVNVPAFATTNDLYMYRITSTKKRPVSGKVYRRH